MTTADPDDWRRPGPTSAQRRIDVAMGAVVAAVALFNLVLGASIGFDHPQLIPPWPEQVVCTLAVTLPLCLRRRYPAIVAVIIAVVFIVAQALSVPEPQMSSIALCVALYTLGAWGRDRRLATRLRIGIIAAMFVWLGIGMWLAASMGMLTEKAPSAPGPLPPVLAAILARIITNAMF